MEPKVHENYIKASNLMFWALGLGFIGSLINGILADNGSAFFIGIFAMIFNLVFALLTRQGHSWIKIVLAVFYGLGLVIVPFVLIAQFNTNPLVGFISITVTVLQITALVRLFQVPADWVPPKVEETEEEEGETEDLQTKETTETYDPEEYVKPDLGMPENYGKLGN